MDLKKLRELIIGAVTGALFILAFTIDFGDDWSAPRIILALCICLLAFFGWASNKSKEDNSNNQPPVKKD